MRITLGIMDFLAIFFIALSIPVTMFLLLTPYCVHVVEFFSDYPAIYELWLDFYEGEDKAK